MESLPESSWKESLSALKGLLLDSSKNGHFKVEKCCAYLLDLDTTAKPTTEQSQGSLAENVHETFGENPERTVLPSGLHALISTIYLRALIQLGKYAQVVNYCDKRKQQPNCEETSEANVQEYAYALYRLKRYEACRKVCLKYIDFSKTDEDNFYLNNGCLSKSRGLMHIFAQTLYRLGENAAADSVFNGIMSLTSENNETVTEMDADEREDTLANALANRTSNYTAGSLLLENDRTSWVEKDKAIVNLIQTYGSSDICDDQNAMLQNYDLAYNLATYLLVSSDARSRRYVVTAKQLLTHAEKSALSILDPSSSIDVNDSCNDVKSEEEKVKLTQQKQQQQQLMNQEVGPIRANLALSNLILGGDENLKEALRMYFTCVTKHPEDKTKGARISGIEANVLATASNNLALLRAGKESVFDILKRIPTTNSLSVSEDNISGKGVKRGSSTSKSSSGGVPSVPLVAATPQQVRTVLFNRSLQLAEMGNVNGCLATLAVLRSSLHVSHHNADPMVNGDNASRQVNPSKNKLKGKKKKIDTSVNGEMAQSPNQIVMADEDAPMVKPCFNAETIAWEARADWIESKLYHNIKSDEKSSSDLLKNAIDKIEAAMNGLTTDKTTGALPYLKSHFLLNNAVATCRPLKPQPFITAIESLPSPVKSSPAAVIALASLYGALNKEDSLIHSVKLISELGEDTPALLAISEFHIDGGRYEDAIEILKSLLHKHETIEKVERMRATAFLVQALSYIDCESAQVYAKEINEEYQISEWDGEDLESLEIPRFSKNALDLRSVREKASGSIKVRKNILSKKAKWGAKGERKKKNHESILRKRARKREAYLLHLESQGLYNTNKESQTKPDPERWIHKSQRSYNRRGRRRYKSNIGAQGGGAGIGMEKDAAKLDVAARVTAAKLGVLDVLGKPSTANLKVSGSSQTRKGKSGKRR